MKASPCFVSERLRADLEPYQYLELSELDLLSRQLSTSSSTVRVHTRIEAYSCKSVARERKLFKALEHDLVGDLEHSASVSPPEHHSSLVDSPFGPLDRPHARKTLYLLIALLNVAFPDHDFTRVHPDDFAREADGGRDVLASLSHALDLLRAPANQRTAAFISYPPSMAVPRGPSPSTSPPFGPMSPPTVAGRLSSGTSSSASTAAPAPSNTHPFLRRVLDPIIDLADCEVYSYSPDIDSDPHAESDSDIDDSYGSSDDDDDDEDSDVRPFDLHHHHDVDDIMDMDGIEPVPVQPPQPAALSRVSSYNSSYSPPSSFLPLAVPGGSTMTRVGGYSAPPAASFATMRRSSYSPHLLPNVPERMPLPKLTHDDEEDDDDDAASGGLLWSSYYFLYNRKMKRILFVSAWARRREPAASADERLARQRRHAHKRQARASFSHGNASSLPWQVSDVDDSSPAGSNQRVAFSAPTPGAHLSFADVKPSLRLSPSSPHTSAPPQEGSPAVDISASSPAVGRARKGSKASSTASKRAIAAPYSLEAKKRKSTPAA